MDRTIHEMERGRSRVCDPECVDICVVTIKENGHDVARLFEKLAKAVGT